MKGLQLTAATRTNNKLNMNVSLEERTIGRVMLEAIKMTQREFGVASIEMYKGYAEEKDLWLKVERRETEREFYVSTTPPAQQNNRLSTAARLEREGFSFVSWAECDEGVRGQIEGLRGEIELKNRWLPTDFSRLDRSVRVRLPLSMAA